MTMRLLKVLFVNLLLLHTVFALSRLLKMACNRNSSLHFCEENSGERVEEANSSSHFRVTEERLIGSREVISLDDSFELEKMRPLPRADDFSSFSLLFANIPTLFESELPELSTIESNNKKEEKHQETKEESNSQTSGYCTNFEENFTFYCDRAISSVPKELRSFCISYVTNCPKRLQS